MIYTISKNSMINFVLLLILIVLPLFVPNYVITVITEFYILAIFALAFNLLFGFTGLLSFGQAAYFGAGAYLFAIVVGSGFGPLSFNSFIPAMIFVIVAVGLIASVIGFICVRVSNISFAMLTLAFTMMIYHLVIQLNEYTNGYDGLVVANGNLNIIMFDLNLFEPLNFYYVSFVSFAMTTMLLRYVTTSNLGRIFESIRESESRSVSVGINIMKYKWYSFIIAGTISGLAGGLSSIQSYVVTPESVHWITSTEPLMATLIGGPWSFAGPIVGSLIFVGLEHAIANIIIDWRILLGFILLGVVLYAENGVTGLIKHVNVKSIKTKFTRAPENKQKDKI